MIEALRIADLAILEAAELEFGPGLNVLTGETGAGKSIVLGALALLAGARSSSEFVRDGAGEASVEALFRSDCHPELELALVERGFAVEDHEVWVRRSVSAAGRSRARLAGESVPVSTLAELLNGHLEISSQHSSQALRRADAPAVYLDTFGSLTELARRVREDFTALRSLDAELAELQARAEERARERDFLSFQRDEIDAVGLEPDELRELESLHARLAHAERLQSEGRAAVGALSGDPERPEAESAGDRLAEAAKLVGGLADLDTALAPVAERLDAVAAELRDAASELEHYVDSLDAEPGRLAEVEERLAAVDRLRRKYGDTAEAILAFRERIAAELAESQGADARLATLAPEREARAKSLADAAKRLSRGRVRAAKALAKEVEGGLHELAMPDARFRVELAPVAPPDGFPCAAGGAETVAFGFSANPGAAPRPLQKVASGGELSRVLLALKNALRRAGAGMVLVFDEVDAGIGGRVAERVGRTLAELATAHQVLCITHAPQIAAFADVHFVVEKAATEAGRARVGIRRISGDERVEELARMAGGEEIGEETRRHARALLASSRSAAASAGGNSGP
ncbi:MAG: DNA repair protein RecN [Proteobacteria bacterium]|nr:DNA repair protein RecN [Pseudomonadota bacterium]